MKRWSWKYIVWILLYAAMIVTILLVLLQVRQQAQRDAQNPEHQQHWEDYKGKTAEEQSSGKSPVKRDIPDSKAPPLTVLMADHFLVCLVASCVFATALFVTLVFLVQGSYNSSVATNEEPTGETDHER